MKIKKINHFLFISACTLTFLGYYIALLLHFYFGYGGDSTVVTIPVRLVIGSLFGILIMFNVRSIRAPWELKIFLIFGVIFLFRIAIDYNKAENFYLDYESLLFYFFSFCLLPFAAISIVKFDKITFTQLIHSLLLPGLIFSFLVIAFYGQFVGVVGRLSSNTVGEDVISPLTLSYSSILIIGVLSVFLLYNKVGWKMKIFSLVAISLSVVPFFLGASRGSLIALIIPFFFLGRYEFKKNWLKYIILFGLLFLVLLFLDDYFNSGLFNRFFGISDAIKQGSSSASRLEIWASSLNQFLKNPIIGDKLRMDYGPGYPHNLFLEVMQTTGILGLIPLLIIIYSAWIKIIFILKYHKKYFWITIFFIQAFFQSMFSGSLYSSAWLWTSMAIVFSLYYTLRGRDSIVNEIR